MSDGFGTFAYLPWLRRGIGLATTRTNSDMPAQAQPRSTVDVTVPFTDASRTAEVKGLALVGPGEIAGTNPQVVVARTWPRDGVMDVENNYFPLLEFGQGQADLPWRYTPARADTRDRLRPWCCLVALEEDSPEIAAFVEPDPTERRLARVRVGAQAPLPRLEQSWAWAHAEVAGVKAPSLADVRGILEREPARIVARLLCPRHLRPNRKYLVLLVPAFLRGVRAGLKQPVPDSIDAMAPAWPTGQRTQPLELPVYHHWRFGTGPGGDFEALVDKLDKGPLPATVGRRDMDVTAPGGGLPSAATTPLGVEGALRSGAMTPSPWDAAQRAGWIAALDRRVARADDLLAGSAGTPREVALPWYGRWHAGLRSLRLPAPPAPPAPWPWHQELNADPRLRVAAALGTLVVQGRQQQLMAGAWRQVQAIREINEELRLAQLAREAAARVYAHFVTDGDHESVIALTAPVHSLVRRPGVSPAETVRGLVARSRIGVGVLDAAFRRIARPLGPLGRRQDRPGKPSELLVRMERGELSAAVPPPLPSGLSAFAPAGLRRGRSLDPARVQSAAGSRGFVSREVRPEDPLPDPPTPRPADPVREPHPFRQAVGDLFGDLIVAPAAPPAIAEVDVKGLADDLRDALDPVVTIPAAYKRRLSLEPGHRRDAAVDPLEPVLAAPTFPQPMFGPLRELSQDWVLPGLEEVPANMLSLLVTNRRFVEAYMVGLNHEMNRELLVNEFPTDQRGTPFRRFWDPSGAVPERPPDIAPIAEWARAGVLGANGPASVTAEEDRLVLLIRGDLLRRYPTTILSAVKAKPGPAFDLGGREEHPIFSGTLEPDVAFFGFNLTPSQAAGEGTDPGWYFVLCEQPSETRFGLDEAETAKPMASWADLTWAHMTVDHGYIDLTRPLTPPANQQGAGWDTHSAAMAVITSQQPVRVAIHARRMLPAQPPPP